MNRLLLIGLVVLGAGGALWVSVASPAVPAPLEDLPARFGEVLCSKGYACCTPEERQGLPGSSEASCKTSAAAHGQDLTIDISRSARAGRARYDAVAASECLSRAQAASCKEFIELQRTDACMLGIVPLVPAGGACTEWYECIDGHCSGANPNGASWPAEDEPPIDGVCVGRRGLGAKCFRGEDCESRVCDSVEGNAGTCVPKRTLGQECDSDSECASYFCNDNGKCVPRTTHCPL